MRTCTKCGIEEDKTEFCKDRSVCKACYLTQHAEYRKKNRSLLKEKSREYRKHNSEYLKNYHKKYNNENEKKRSDYHKQYRSKNKDKIANRDKLYYEKHKYDDSFKERRFTYYEKKLKNNIFFKLSKSLRVRLHHAIKNNYKTGSAVRDLGCSIEELKTYLESKFQPGMSWDNWSTRGWHIDHIIPLSSFDLTNREELLKACHYTNLQPLWAVDNLKKSNKMERKNAEDQD